MTSFLDQIYWPYVTNAAFAAFIIFGVWVTYYSFRRSLGHERINGCWYRADEARALKQEQYADLLDERMPNSPLGQKRKKAA